MPAFVGSNLATSPCWRWPRAQLDRNLHTRAVDLVSIGPTAWTELRPARSGEVRLRPNFGRRFYDEEALRSDIGDPVRGLQRFGEPAGGRPDVRSGGRLTRLRGRRAC